jgi:hypothetical protein
MVQFRKNLTFYHLKIAQKGRNMQRLYNKEQNTTKKLSCTDGTALSLNYTVRNRMSKNKLSFLALQPVEPWTLCNRRLITSIHRQNRAFQMTGNFTLNLLSSDENTDLGSCVLWLRDHVKCKPSIKNMSCFYCLRRTMLNCHYMAVTEEGCVETDIWNSSVVLTYKAGWSANPITVCLSTSSHEPRKQNRAIIHVTANPSIYPPIAFGFIL